MAMYKSKCKSPIPNHHVHQRPSSPLAQTRTESPARSSTMDLRKFNDYLQERIARSAIRKEQQVPRKDYSLKRIAQHLPPSDSTPTKQLLKNTFENPKESRIKKSRENPSNKTAWRKHQSIQSLLNKQNEQNVFYDENRRTECQNQQALRDLEKKYQDLQEKYKLLMKEATLNARQFQKDKKQLNQLQMMHRADQGTLTSLKKELKVVQNNMDFDGKSQGNQKSVLKIKSQSNIPLGHSKIYSGQNMWESKQQSAKAVETPIRNVRYRTGQNWTSNLSKTNLFQSEEKPQNSRYYSCQKQPEQTRKSMKTRKASDHNIYENKAKDSLKGSRVGPVRPSTETCIRLDYDLTKSTTPTTLHKKMLGPKQYSKYRFQPSVKID